MAEIVPIVSEALQQTIRQLLPSQNGFGDDLQAMNVIVPIIDLTPSAEGSSLGTSLQQAWDYGISTASASNSTAVLVNTSGFWKVSLAGTLGTKQTVEVTASLTISDGITPKNLVSFREGSTNVSANEGMRPFSWEGIVFLDSGESISLVSNDVYATMDASARQVASVTGVLQVPLNFIAQ